VPEGSTQIKFGIFLPPQPSWDVLRERAVLVEQLGFESLWMGDKFVAPGDPEVPWMDGWTLLAGFAAITSHIRVGSLITNMIYRNPAVIAKSAMTVDNISGGRMTLGLGASSPSDLCHPMTGVEAWSNPERVSRFEEVVTIVDRMLRNPESSFTGKYYQIKGAAMLPAPIQKPRPPLLIGAEGPRMLKIAAKYADNWNSVLGFRLTPKEAVQCVKDNNQRLSELALTLGRDPESITRSFCVGWTSDRPFDSPAAFQDFVGRYAEAGIQQFMLGYWLESEEPRPVPMRHINTPEMLEQYALETIPRIR
jgi:alkanesulfonate monooxygenase SsuD/methylene tetrahydromethanopterin reductase-like flavin-dependent oxidoreductase (luciferase family)